MSYRLKVWSGLLLLIAAFTCVHAAVQVGDKFPPLSATAFTGGEMPSPSGHITLVDFWASWCSPCKDSFPAYAQLHADYAPRGLLIVAVSVDETPAAYNAFVKSLAPPFVVARDTAHQLVRQVEVAAMPTCYLLDRSGRVRFVHQGFHGASTERAIRREIDLLLSEKTASL